MPAFPRPLAALTGLGLVASALATVSMAGPAQAASNTLVINEVYAGAGSPGAVRQRDYVELRNISGGTLDLQGMSLQTRAPGATGVAHDGLPAAADPAPQQRDLPRGRRAGPAGSAIPTPDATSGLSFVVNTGQVWLAEHHRADRPEHPARDLPVASPATDVVDFYGWGNLATSFEGSRGPGTGTTTSAQRDDQRGQRQQHDGLPAADPDPVRVRLHRCSGHRRRRHRRDPGHRRHVAAPRTTTSPRPVGSPPSTRPVA